MALHLLKIEFIVKSLHIKRTIDMMVKFITIVGLPFWLRWSRTCQQCRRSRFDPGVGKIPGEGNGYPLQRI